ncbi:MAG: hypothetical protein ABL921_14345 [Pirellula sp.]
MNENTESPAELHSDHRRWQSDISMWDFDIEQWRSELSKALDDLDQIAAMLRHHKKNISEHADVIETMEAALEFHEKNLAASLNGCVDSDLDDALRASHSIEAKKIVMQRESHERIKKHHHIAMASVAMLKNALSTPPTR